MAQSLSEKSLSSRNFGIVAEYGVFGQTLNYSEHDPYCAQYTPAKQTITPSSLAELRCALPLADEPARLPIPNTKTSPAISPTLSFPAKL